MAIKSGNTPKLTAGQRLDIKHILAIIDAVQDKRAEEIGAVFGHHSGVLAMGDLGVSGSTVTLPKLALYGCSTPLLHGEIASSAFSSDVLPRGFVMHYDPTNAFQASQASGVLDLSSAEAADAPVSIFWRRQTTDADLDSIRVWQQGTPGFEGTVAALTKNREYVQFAWNAIANWAESPDGEGWNRLMTFTGWSGGEPAGPFVATPLDDVTPLGLTSSLGNHRFGQSLNDTSVRGVFTPTNAIRFLWNQALANADSDYASRTVRRGGHTMETEGDSIFGGVGLFPVAGGALAGGRKQLQEQINDLLASVAQLGGGGGGVVSTAGAMWSANIAADGTVTTSFGLSGVTVVRENEGGSTQYVYTLTVPGVTLLTGFHAQALNGVWASNLNTIVTRLQTVTVVGSDLVIKYSLHRSTTDNQGQALAHYVTLNGGTA